MLVSVTFHNNNNCIPSICIMKETLRLCYCILIDTNDGCQPMTHTEGITVLYSLKLQSIVCGVYFQLAPLENAYADPDNDPTWTEQSNYEMQKMIRTIPIVHGLDIG